MSFRSQERKRDLKNEHVVFASRLMRRSSKCGAEMNGRNEGAYAQVILILMLLCVAVANRSGFPKNWLKRKSSRPQGFSRAART